MDLFDELRGWAAAAAWPVDTIAYGGHPDAVGDLRLPRGPGPFPVAVVLHGGFWRAEYDRSIMDAAATALAAEGWAAWNVEYRRTGAGGGIPATLDDVAAAAAALDRLDAPLDRSETVAVGHSAGGHLALWLAGTTAVTAALGLAAVCDLAAAAQERLGDGAAVEFAGGTPAERPEAYELADPAARLPAGVPQLLLHGDRDDIVPIAHARSYAARALAAGDRCEIVELSGARHFELIDPRAGEWREVVAALDRLRRA